MNVSRAKNLIIILFILLNAGLFALNYIRDSRYQLSDKAQRDITAFLSKNGIALSAKIPAGFRPARQINLSPLFTDIDRVAEWLFTDMTGLEKTTEFDRIIYTTETESLRYDKKQFVFEAEPQGPAFGLNPESAGKLCGERLAALGDKEARFELDSCYEWEGSLVLDYRMKTAGLYIHSSYVRFWVSGRGITRISCSMFACNGFFGAPREIHSPDEALLLLARELRNIFGDEPLEITRMDMVYALDSGQTAESAELKAAPCYRIYIAQSPEPFLINAYFNTMLK